MADYRMTFDLHTHTAIRKAAGEEILHAKGTVEENVRAASEKGLSAIGISNHGPGHVTYGLPVDCIPTLLGEIHEAQARYPEIKIYFGVEANIINASGKLDVADEDYDRFDYVMAGYHYGIFGETPLRAALIHACNWLYERAEFVRDLADDITLGGSDGDETGTERLTRMNTQLMTEAILKNRLRVLTHPGDKGPFDIDAVAKACAATGTWMEINNSHRDLTVEGIQTAAKYDVKFVIGSDAHCPDCVGLFENGLDRALQAGLSLDRIVNIEPVSGGWAMRTGLQEITAKRNTDIPRTAASNEAQADETDKTASSPGKIKEEETPNRAETTADKPNPSEPAANKTNRPETAADKMNREEIAADKQRKTAAAEPMAASEKRMDAQASASGKSNEAASETGSRLDMVAAVFNGLDKTAPRPDRAEKTADKPDPTWANPAVSHPNPTQPDITVNKPDPTGPNPADKPDPTQPTGPDQVTAATQPDPTRPESETAQPFESAWNSSDSAWNSSGLNGADLNTDKQGQSGGTAKGPRRYPIHASYRHRDMKAALTARRQTMK